MSPTVDFDGDSVFPARYNEDERIYDHNHEPPGPFVPASPSHLLGGTSGDPNIEPIFLHDTPSQHGDIPAEGTYPFVSEHSSPVRVQNENPGGTYFLSNPPGDGSSRYGGVGASFSSSLLTPRPKPDHTDNQYESYHNSLIHEVGIQDDPGPSGSGIINSVSSCILKRWRPCIDG